MRILISVFFVSCITLMSYAQLPIAFDLRNVNGNNYISSIKSQQGGTCWTHGAMAAIESNLMITNNWTLAGDTGEPNLAEYHLDWWNGFNKFYNYDYPGFTGDGLDVHMGGDYRVTSAYLSRGDGSVRDIDAPSYSNAPDFFDISYKYYYTPTIEWLKLGKNFSNINYVKQRLIDYGAIGSCMCVGAFWGNNNTHYQPENDSSEPNHAIAIIGWNDTLKTDAENPGAWLCKNSWGVNWGDSGYFWISYYDKHCGKHPEMGLIQFLDTDVMKYDNVHYHDYHGWRDTLTNISKAFNKFQTINQEALKAASFFTAEDTVNYTINVYLKFDNGILDSNIYTKSGMINISGFHTIELDSAVLIDSLTDFYLSVDLDKGGHPIDVTSYVPVLLGAKSRTLVTSNANPSESFYWDNGSWYDLYNYNLGQFTNTANFCMKALSIDTNFIIQDTINSGVDKEMDYKFNVYPNPSSGFITLDLNVKNEIECEFLIYSINGKLIFNKDLKLQKGDNTLKINELQAFDKGIYYIVIKSDKINYREKLIVR